MIFLTPMIETLKQKERICFSALFPVFQAVFFFAALSFAFSASESGAFGAALSDFSLSGISDSGIYTRTTPQALVISGDGMLVIEESDSFSRPALRTEWKDGEEYAVTRWDYAGEGMYPCVRVTSSPEGSSRVVFDADGMETERVFLSTDGTPLSRSLMEYAPASGERSGHDLVSLTEETFSPSGESLSSERSVYSYNDDGSVKSRAVYQDGIILKIIQYGEGNSRSETVFHEGKELYTAEYRDGERIRAGRRAEAVAE